MKILAFAASNSSKSINQQLVTYAASLVAGADVEILNIHDYEMPIYRSDREDEGGIPEQAQMFKDKIAAADALIISYAEHNGSYTAAYKNLFDWASRLEGKVFQGKSMIILSTSPGPGGAGSVMAMAKKSAPFFGAEVKGDLSVPKFYENFDTEAGKLSNAELDTELKAVVNTLR